MKKNKQMGFRSAGVETVSPSNSNVFLERKKSNNNIAAMSIEADSEQFLTSCP